MLQDFLCVYIFFFHNKLYFPFHCSIDIYESPTSSLLHSSLYLSIVVLTTMSLQLLLSSTALFTFLVIVVLTTMSLQLLLTSTALFTFSIKNCYNGKLFK